MEALRSDRSLSEIARAYDVHPVTVSQWKKHFEEHGAEVFGGKEEVKHYEKQVSKLERTVDKKVSQVLHHGHQCGLNQCCEVFALSKGTWQYPKQCDDSIDMSGELPKTRLREVIREHPVCGCCRLKPALKTRTGQRISHKRLRRPLRETNPSLIRHLPRYRPSNAHEILRDNPNRVDLVKGRTLRVLDALSTDFTELRYVVGSRKAWFMAMVDIEGKWALGWAWDFKETGSWLHSVGRGHASPLHPWIVIPRM